MLPCYAIFGVVGVGRVVVGSHALEQAVAVGQVGEGVCVLSIYIHKKKNRTGMVGAAAKAMLGDRRESSCKPSSRAWAHAGRRQARCVVGAWHREVVVDKGRKVRETGEKMQKCQKCLNHETLDERFDRV